MLNFDQSLSASISRVIVNSSYYLCRNQNITNFLLLFSILQMNYQQALVKNKIIIILRWLKFVLIFLVNKNARVALKCILTSRKITREKNIKIMVYDRLDVHSDYTSALVSKLSKNNKIILLCGIKNHRYLNVAKENVISLYFPNYFEIYLRFINVNYFLTAATSFSPLVKNKKSKFIHLFHSPVSMHYIYPDDAFDVFDIFFLVGKHHDAEFNQLKKTRKWIQKTSYCVGYTKLDRIITLKNGIQKKPSYSVRIVFAPSWGPNNLLRKSGLEIISQLLTNGFHVTLRPHIHSFQYDVDVLEEILIKVKSFKGQFSLDNGKNIDALLHADLLISDWSGVAYEYAFGLEKPVIFLNCQQKLLATHNRKIKLPPMENECRQKVGILCEPKDIVDSVRYILADFENYKNKIISAREDYIFNLGKANESAYSILQTLLSNTK